MEFKKILNEQKQRIANFEKFKTNYVKANKQEKAKLGFQERRLERLNAWYVEFDKVNTELNSVADKSDDYFTDDIFRKYNEEYILLRTTIQNVIYKLNRPVPTTSKIVKNSVTQTQVNGNMEKNDENEHETGSELNNTLQDSDSETDTYGDDEQCGEPPEVRVLKHLVNELKVAFQIANDSEVMSSRGLANAQLENLKSLWLDARATHRTILMSEASNYCEEIELNELQKLYLKTCGKLNEVVDIGNERWDANLPKLKLPDFDGTTSWKAFKDIFDEIVHTRKGLSNRAKAQYLKTVLKGEAATVVSHLETNEDNYQMIYDALVKRYDNKRKTCGELIDKLLSLPKQMNETSAALQAMHDVTNECITAIKSLKVDTKSWDPLVVHILMRKLSKATILDYESKLTNVRELQTLNEFLKYIENRFMALLSTEMTEKSSETTNFKTNEKVTKNEITFKCAYCEKPHSIYKCFEFLKLEVKKRSEWVKEKKVCVVCLLPHEQGMCKSKFDRKTCKKKHNSLLHFETKKEANTTLISTTSEAKTENVSTLIATKDEKNLLATAIVRVKARNGDMIGLRAVVDQGSQGSMLTENALQKLNLPVEKVITGVDGLSGAENVSKKRVKLEISPRFSDDYVLQTHVLVLKKITNLAVFKGDLKEYSHLQNLLYADPTIQDDSPIDLLLNVADYTRIVKQGLIKGADDEPMAQNTEFGWLIMGPQREKSSSFKVTSLISNMEIEEQLNKFFAAENINSEDEMEDGMTAEEEYCEKHFIETTKRNDDGRFITSIPFKNEQGPKFGESKKAALATLFQLGKRFEKQPKLKQKYVEAMNEAIAIGHLKLIENVPEQAYFIPHHAVFKQSSTTQVRPVYNASKKTSNGFSLNEQLAIGKMDQPDMLTIILRWRKYEIGILADLEKMYKQIQIPPEQYHLQLIC